MKILSLTLLACLFMTVDAYASQTDSLMRVLDNTLEKSELFVAAKERIIGRLKEEKSREDLSDDQKYTVNKKLIDEYRSYIYDSAMNYVMLNRGLSERLADKVMVAESRIDLANVLLGGGMQKEALETLGMIDRKTIPGNLLGAYYLCYEQSYLHLSIYVAGTMYEEKYRNLSRAYVDSLAMITTESPDNYFALSRIYLADDNPKITMVRLEDLLDKLEPGSHGYAIVASTLADCCRDDAEKRKKYLILSSLSDVSSAVKEYVSLFNLADMLYFEEDVERAYRYATISMTDANIYNARLRRAEMSKTYPILESAYKRELDYKNFKLKIFILSVSILSVIIFVVSLYIYRQALELRKVRKKLIEANDMLVETNNALHDANKMKEEYLGRFLGMCSSYINRLERYQKMVHYKLTTGKVDEVRIMTRSSDAIDYEINEFYKSFDKAFLHLYPNYVERFNSLLRREEITKPREGEMLTTEMRIYALVRLGISDSSSIAKFLRYSANTVYTYRHKTRMKAISKETFDEDILNIGF